MSRVRRFLASGAVLLLLCAALGQAHGDDNDRAHDGHATAAAAQTDMHSHGSALPGTNVNMTMANGEPMRPSYFRTKQHASLMYAHIALMLFSWVALLPIAVMLSIARSKLKIPFQLAFLLFNAFGILTSLIYNAETPKLYPGNAHHPLGWAITWIACAWTLMGLVSLYTQKPKQQPRGAQRRPLLATLAQYQRLDHDDSSSPYRSSDDSGHGIDRHPDSLTSSSRTQSWGSDINTHRKEFQEDEDEYDHSEGPASPGLRVLRNSRLDAVLSTHAPRIAGRSLMAFNFVHVALERTVLILGFVGLCTGGAVYGGIFHGRAVFSGLAHWIKGGIFFWYGLLAFGRWMGCFADFGWAWNRKPNPNKLSSEFWESFVIFFYGASNVWLEHLAAWGEDWTAVDFQHLSITVMFFGGGLLGMLIESKRVRQLLNLAVDNDDSHAEHDEEWKEPESYSISINPIPAIIIMLLGIMMSSHTQHSMVGGMVHKQWGMLFTAGSLARGMTYLSMWLKPPRSQLPSRPPTELIASFCMVSGGAIFMASSENTVDVLVQNHLDAMFIFTVINGMTCLLLAWELAVVAFKGWVVDRSRRRSGTRQSHSPSSP